MSCEPSREVISGSAMMPRSSINKPRNEGTQTITFLPHDIVVKVGDVYLEVSSHIISVISDVWRRRIAYEKTLSTSADGIEIKLATADDPQAFQYIMNAAHYQADNNPNSLSVADVCSLAEMCAKYGLQRFFKHQTELTEKCAKCATNEASIMSIEQKMKISWTLGLKQIFELNWKILMTDISTNVRGQMCRVEVSVEQIMAGSNGVKEKGLVHEALLPAEVKKALKLNCKKQLDELERADVFEALFEVLLEDHNDSETCCQKFREQNLGRLVFEARAVGYIKLSTTLPIERSPTHQSFTLFSPKTTAAWLKHWIERLEFQDCDCRCEESVWEFVRAYCAMVCEKVPRELQEHFETFAVLNKRRRED